MLAACLTNSGIESGLGLAAGSLAWGPALFRALLGFHAIWLLMLPSDFHPRPAMTTPPIQRRWTRTTGAIVVGLMLCAAAVRLWRLGSDLWLDEVLMLVQLVRLPIARILTSFSSQNQHMLYSILAHASVAAFGESAWALRLPSMIFGCLSIWPMYLLARLVAGRREALLASTFMVFSTHHVWFSQNARGYMGLLFFSLLATWAWLKACSSESTRWWVWYVGAVVLGVWMNMTMIFIPASHFAIHVFSSRRRWHKPYVAWLLAGSLTLQLYALSLPDFFQHALHESSFASE